MSLKNKQNIFITGISSGIGYALAKAYLQKNYQVFGLSRRDPYDLNKFGKLQFQSVDLSQIENIHLHLSSILKEADSLELVILNAGILGNIKDIKDTSLEDLKHIMDINLWANKVICDYLFGSNIPIKQLVSISSGAAVNGNRGWNGYALSKAGLNMLTKLYASEEENTHFSALAPGLIDTAMQDYIYNLPSCDKYPSLDKLKQAKGTVNMPDPDEAALMLIETFPKLLKFQSGSFIDIRQL